MRAEAPPHLLHVFSTFAMGGPQRRFVQIANAFASRFRHTIIAMDGRTEAASGLSASVRHEIHPVTLDKGGSLSLGNLWRIVRALRAERPALLLTYNWGAIEWLVANRLFGFAPHLHFEDGFGPEEAGGIQLPRRVWTRRLAIGGPVSVVVPSRTLEQLARETWRVPARRLHYAPNGIELARFATGKRMELPFAEGNVVVGSVGALRAEKNLARLLRIVHAVRDLPVALAIIGEGPERAQLEAESRRLGLGDRVFFAGHQADPSPAYSAFDLLALTSDTEQMPYSVIEGMAAGLPVLATDVGDVSAMLAPAHANSCTFAPGDEAGFAERLRALVMDRKARAAIGSANRSHAVAHFDLTAMLAAYDRLFREHIAQPASR